MTILAAAIGPDGTWIGADTLVTADGRIVETSARKWTLSPNGRWAFAGGGSWAFDFALRDADIWPDVEGQFGVVLMAAAMRARLLGLPEFEVIRDDEPFGDFDWSPLVVGPGGVWRINSNLWTIDSAIEGVYQAAGAGQDFAAAAMSALLAAGETSAEAFVLAGIETACRMSVWCGGEIFLHKMDRSP